jgi:two-component system cell cycle sensor histidine kinase/response regulator CckA
MNRSHRSWRARNVLVEAAGLAFVSAGLAIGMLPERLRENVELPAAVFVLIGAVIWIQVLKAAAQSRNELSSSLQSQGRAQQELAWSEDRLLFAQEVARMGTWDTDLVTGEGIWSDSLRDAWGIDESVEPTYENFVALVHPEDRRRVAEIVVPAERDGGDFEYEYRVCRPDGEIRWFLCRGRIVLGQDGGPARSLGVAMDITHRKRAEEDRTRLEEQLRQAQKLQAIGRLAGSVAHDFNNLLLAIRGYGELAQNAIKRGDEPSAEIGEIVAVADRAADLTGQLLAFSRKQMLRPEVVELNGVVGEMRKLLQLLVGESVELDVADRKRDVHVNADRSQLEQVIANLAVNARDAMPAGGRLSIEVGTAELGPEQGLEQKSRPCAVLVVSDTGCGMDAQTAGQVFEPFFTTKEEGTGLGLATVHGIVTQSGGSIWVYSELGQGTTFKIYLPLVEAERRELTAAPASPSENSSGETILLVEDDAQVRGIVAAMLETRGYRVLAAGDADTAAELAGTSTEIDLILSDLAVAGSNGRDIAERARKLHPHARVLHMSGYTDDTVLRRGVLELGSAFIEKPFSSEELARRVRDVLDGRSAGRSAA